MTESIVERLALPVDDSIDHPPSKKIKLDETSEQSYDFSTTSGLNSNNSKAFEDDEFDAVQAILEAGKKCREEEESKLDEDVDKSESSRSSFDNKDEEDVLSVDESEEDESDANNDDTKETKAAAVKPSSGGGKGIKSSKKKKKKKNKSSTLRRNIKDILKHDQLDDLTIAARKEEEKRRQRMNLKLQQLQQQQLKLLQYQQSQLLRESLSIPDNYQSPPVSSHSTELHRLIRKKHITVSLDESGVPKERPPTNEDDCILLSSDDEAETSHRKEPPSFSSLCFPSQVGAFPSAISDFKHRTQKDEIIALSSGDEDNNDVHKTSLLQDGSLGNSSRLPRKGVEVESDDDCVIITPDETEGDEEVEEKDELSQDLINVPDHLGRVLVNVGHPEEDEDVFLPPQIAKIVKPHQIGGIRFLYDNVIESKDRYNESTGFGCILAHAMGLGKTLQTVAFCDVLLRTAGKTALIIVPINTIQNWLNEFNRYLPSENAEGSGGSGTSAKRRSKVKLKKPDNPDTNTNGCSSSSDKEQTEDSLASNSMPNSDIPPSVLEESLSSSQQSEETISPLAESSPEEIVNYRTFEVYLLNETVKSLQARERIITTWTEKGGVLLLGYEMYRMLALKKLKKSSKKAMTLVHEEMLAEAHSLDRIYDCLVEPGPDCVICDEGHRIKNSGAGISQALKAIKTKRRVVLTGYPLQNNLMEYWCMVDFVRPNYLGTKAEFSNMFERPIQNGQCADSTQEDKRLMKYRSHVLHSLLEGFVQRRSHIVLRNALPQKEEWVFLVKLTPIQLKIYREFIRYLREDLESDNATTNPIKAFAVCCKIWNHPDVLWNVVKKNIDLELDLDIDEVRPVARSKPRGTGRPRGRPPLNGISLSSQTGSDQFDGPLFTECNNYTKAETSGISLEWAKPLFENYTPEVMEHGVKFQLLFQLIDESVAVKDKLLVFSQSLLTLDLIEIFLKKRLDWRKSVDYVRLDGSTAGLEREKLINEFNKSEVQKLFIISTRAGSLGINLVGANRVCIFDASWNPCHDSQAVCRVYRYGQTKPCHIYRFVSDCTLEKRIYDRQVNKKGMADRIVDEMNPNTPFKSKDVSSFLVLQHELLDKLPYIRCDVDIEKYSDSVIKNILSKMGDKITQEPFEHESLLIDQKHQRLSKMEKRLALKNYEKEKQTVANSYATYSRPSYAQYYSSVNTMTPSTQSPYSTGSPVSRYNDPIRMPSPTNLDVMRGSSRSSTEAYGSLGKATLDRFELHINALKTRGIAVFPVQLHQDTFLNDPTGVHDLYIRSGERVYILVSQKGTYLRVQQKLLKVPYVGTEMNQKLAEHFVLSLLQVPPRSKSRSLGYPAEQQLPASSMLFQKNANHLQITNSRNNTGGDVMTMGSTNWENTGSSSQEQPQQQNPLSRYLNDDYRSLNGSHNSGSAYSQTDLQSLSRLTEAFCQQQPTAASSEYPSSLRSFSSDRRSAYKQWSSTSSTPHKQGDLVSSVSSPELEVIKLAHSQSSNHSSSSSNSRTNSPYRQTWSNSNDATNNGWVNKEAVGKSDNPAFYTDFTITPISSSSNGSPSSRKQPGQVGDKYNWHNEYFGHSSRRENPSSHRGSSPSTPGFNSIVNQYVHGIPSPDPTTHSQDPALDLCNTSSRIGDEDGIMPVSDSANNVAM